MINYPDGAEPPRDGERLSKDVMPFASLHAAGGELADRLEKFRHTDGLIVIAIMSAGLPVADEVAKALEAPLDVLLIRRLLTPDGPGSQSCAVNVAGTMVIDEDCNPRFTVPSTPFEHFIADALAELAHREQVCRQGRPHINLEGKTIILVDCGIRSSSTMQAAIKALRATGPGKIIAAVPSASTGGSASIAALADEFICLVQPNPFGNVALWYKDFTRPGDDQVGEFLR